MWQHEPPVILTWLFPLCPVKVMLDVVKICQVIFGRENPKSFPGFVGAHRARGAPPRRETLGGHDEPSTVWTLRLRQVRMEKSPKMSNKFKKHSARIRKKTHVHITNVKTYHRDRCSAKRWQCKVVEVMCSLGWFLPFFRCLIHTEFIWIHVDGCVVLVHLLYLTICEAVIFFRFSLFENCFELTPVFSRFDKLPKDLCLEQLGTAKHTKHTKHTSPWRQNFKTRDPGFHDQSMINVYIGAVHGCDQCVLSTRHETSRWDMLEKMVKVMAGLKRLEHLRETPQWQPEWWFDYTMIRKGPKMK